ncbi:ADP-ribosylglycohydrolase family protein [Microbacterium elymi]|uniref:ADP-ribosylglycohydrolase family protein n=1 Tax=Microbacterium elymi TaxID=2909587 RepID=A0ABY5NHJ3_9MICO|nr:ADP-ribosylglycohydrolase family protein [Microbacterium elymi]UUT34630.1 ADP-ribosylglycohydrolase family protein [Microbacterium elymi]
MSTISARDRARGSMAGLAIGDAIGRPVEGLSAQEIQDRYGRVEGYLQWPPAGSDDTEYALLTARTIHRVGVAATADDFAQTWIEDVLPQLDNFAGGGFSEMAAIDNLRRGIRPPQSGDHIHAWSDGLAMRVAPLGIVSGGDTDLATRLTIADGEVSHSGEGIHAGVAVAVAVSAAMSGATARDAYAAALTAIPADSWTARNLVAGRALVDAESDPGRLAIALHGRLAVDDYYWADLAPEAVGLAMAAVLAGDGDFRASVLFAVNLGRDADTIAAMAGCIAGAISGVGAIPADWVEALRPVEGSCIRSTAGIHPLDAADALIDLWEQNR